MNFQNNTTRMQYMENFRQIQENNDILEEAKLHKEALEKRRIQMQVQRRYVPTYPQKRNVGEVMMEQYEQFMPQALFNEKAREMTNNPKLTMKPNRASRLVLMQNQACEQYEEDQRERMIHKRVDHFYRKQAGVTPFELHEIDNE